MREGGGRRDLRTNKRDTSTSPGATGPANGRSARATWSEKTPEGRWRAFAYDEVADDLRSALGEIEDILGDLEPRASDPTR